MTPGVVKDGAVLKSDIWSLGISLIELAERINPFEGVSSMNVIETERYNNPPALSSAEWSNDFVDFVSKCLVRNVRNVASLNEVMNGFVIEKLYQPPW